MGINQRKLADFPTFVAADETFQKVQTEAVRVRNRLQEIEAALMAIKQAPTALAAFHAESSPHLESIGPETLRQEYQQIEKRQQFLAKALEEARHQLNNERAAASEKLCKDARPAFAAATKKKLEAKRADAEANRELCRLRDELETAGVKTGSIPISIDGIEDRLVFYERSVKQDFPELNL